MTRHFLNALDDLNQDVLKMGGAVESAVARAVRALLARDVAGANAVIDGDRDVNLQELKIDEECLRILALYQPTAKDLRFVTAVMKITNDLERVGDLAVNVAERAVALSALPPRDVPEVVREMADKVREMLTASIDALVRRDAARAREVLARDAPVDRLLTGLFSAIEDEMRARPELVKADLHVVSAAKNLERIADHACNVAEDVVYLAEGNVLRHMH